MNDLQRVQRFRRFLFSLALDVGIVIGAYALALELKFDGEGGVPQESWRTLLWAGPLIALAYLLTYQALGVYRTAWQYGSLRDAVMLVVSVALVTAAILIINALLPKRPLPLTVNVISAAFILLGHGAVRMFPRLWSMSDTSEATKEKIQRVLIVGAGDTGQTLAWELKNNRSQPYRPVAFVDDNTALINKRVHGIPVTGNRSAIPEAIREYKIDLVAIALPPEPAPGLQNILKLIEPSKVPVRLVPAAQDVLEGRASRGEMREITVEDLLAREPMDVDVEACRAAIAGRAVLITGAAGSIGLELTRRVMSYGPTALHLIDSNETGLHELRVEMVQQSGGDITVKPWLVSISDRASLQEVFETARPQVVFHLAAYKHIRMMEENPDQALETNVLGTLNVFEAAQSVEAEKVVFLSSHTAVNPASVYGASKRIGELLTSSTLAVPSSTSSSARSRAAAPSPSRTLRSPVTSSPSLRWRASSSRRRRSRVVERSSSSTPARKSVLASWPSASSASAAWNPARTSRSSTPACDPVKRSAKR
jgi:FlaA1/EpsC-like NDP-sugar epimerase